MYACTGRWLFIAIPTEHGNWPGATPILQNVWRHSASLSPSIAVMMQCEAPCSCYYCCCPCSSLAVMSGVGHMLGLGDRHLDNLLLESSTDAAGQARWE